MYVDTEHWNQTLLTYCWHLAINSKIALYLIIAHSEEEENLLNSIRIPDQDMTL